MSKYSPIIAILKSEGLNPHIDQETFKNSAWQLLKWSSSQDEYHIYEADVAIEGNNIAWFQSSDQDSYLLRIVQPERKEPARKQVRKFSWTPKTYNPVFGCHCLLLEWIEDHLIFIYQEKHGIYICSIKDAVVNDFYILGAKLKRKGHKIAFETYQHHPENRIRLLEIPSLSELDPITVEEANRLDLVPQGLNQPDEFLKLERN